jgi:sulfite reductase (NADPH) flavoprotein alpha-component
MNAKLKKMQELVADLSRDEIIWLNGYLAGIVAPAIVPGGTNHAQPLTAAPETQSGVSAPENPGDLRRGFTLAYGTETGNAKKLATSFAAKAKKAGVQVKLVSLDQYRLTDLAKEERFYVVISTQGEGEPPVGAKAFYDYLHAEAAPALKLHFAVLALGDTSYPLFCKTGEDVDAQLEKLGGKRVLPLKKCDVDYEEDGANWFEAVLAQLQPKTAAPTAVATASSSLVAAKPKGKKYYQGKVLANINLNGRGSGKQTYHIEIGVEEAVEYEPGDSLAVVPKNRRAVVEEIIRLTGIDPAFEIETDKLKGTVETLLTNELNICYLLTSSVKSYAAITQQQIPDTRMDLKDLLRIYPVKDASQFVEVIKTLKPIAPRLYSISSSPAAHPGELHLTVGKHAFLLQDEQHFGLCSEFLGELSEGQQIRFYIHKNRAFKLPASDKDIIMIGPGIGVAPFRSFVAERDVLGAVGRSWLFFGEEHFTTDFLYQTEWQSWLSTGVLTNMNVAFSGDGTPYRFVEDKLLQHQSEVFTWLEGGATIYVAGEKGPLHEKVEGALKQIIREGKGISEEEAAVYFAELKKSGRYEREVF